MSMIFRIQEPGKRERLLPVGSGMTIGRDPKNDCVIEDPNVSARHARVVEGRDGELLIEDLGSSNKTRVTGGPSLGAGERYELRDGLRLMLGKTVVDVIDDLVASQPEEATIVSTSPPPMGDEPMPRGEEATDRIAPPAGATRAAAGPAADPPTEPERPAAKAAAGGSPGTGAAPRPGGAETSEESTELPAAPPRKVTEPVPKVAPVPKAEPKPEPKAQPKPVPAPKAEPVPKAEPAAKAEPSPKADSSPKAEPAKPAAKAAPRPTPQPAKEPAVPKGTRSPKSFTLNRYHVDLSTYFVRHERVPCRDVEDVLGGVARAFKLLDGYQVDDPHDAGAPLILNLGVLSGTQFMTGLRTYFHGFSPLKASHADKPSAMWTAGSGKFGTKLRYLGIDEVIFTGRAVVPVYLQITPGESGGPARFTFKNAEHLSGKRANEKIQHLHTQYPDAHMAVIGPAGESYESVRFSAIALSTINQLRSGDMKSRFCGRGGFGGVMGSKNLLGIVADTPDLDRGGKVEGLKELNMVVARGEGSRRFRDKKKGDGGGGTWANMTALNPLHAMPEYNFNPTGTDISVPLYRDSVEEAGKFLVKDEACFACGIACHKNIYDNVDGKKGDFHAKFDYEPLNLLSANIGIFDIGQSAELVDLVDDYCMDSISCGVTLAYAMEYNRRKKEAGERSILPAYLEYGNFEGAKRAIEEIGTGRLPLLGQGSKRLSEAMGEPGYAMHCKGVEFPAYLPQFNPGYPWALAGGHMSMRTYLLYVFEKESGIDYWVDAVTQRGPMIMRDDVIGICKFAGTTDEHMVQAITMLADLAITEDELRKAVIRTYLRGYRLEKKAGFDERDYVMPAEAHHEYPNIDLEHFNTAEFFAELSGKVCARFDEMLVEEAL